MAKQPRPLAGKVVAITGAGRGIGRATAAALAAKGARIAVADLDAAAAEQAAAELGPDHAGRAVDVTDAAGFTVWLDEVDRSLGPIDVLINNAGIMPVTPLPDESDASVARQLEINLHAVIRGTQEAMRRMVPRGTGHIVNISSAAGRGGYAYLATYCATKHGVVGLSEAARMELRGTGVEVSVVMPGIVRTELTAGLKDARGVKTLEPEDVANEIVSALEVPRFDVFVPRSTGPLIAVASAMPRRLREGMVRILGADDVALKADRGARVAYEERAAHSAPAAEHETNERSAA